MSRQILKNNSINFSIDRIFDKSYRHMISRIVEDNFYSRFKDKGKFKAICLSGAPTAENPAKPPSQAKYFHYPIKVMPVELHGELLPDPCAEAFKEKTTIAKHIISMYPTVLPISSLDAGERPPGFGEEIWVEFVSEGPQISGKMRGFRYHYPQQGDEYDYYCANQELQSLVGKFAAKGAPMPMGQFTELQGDRPMSETGLPDMGPEMYLGRSKRRKPPTMVVVHTTAGWTKKGAIRTLMKKHLGYHYIIDYDGTVDMLSDPAIWNTWHAPPTNMYSVGISFVNVAWERKGVKEKKIANNTEPWKEYQWLHPRTKRIDRKRKWQPFTNEQVGAYIGLMKSIVSKFNITRENVKMHAEVSKTGKMDPGPAFPWEESLNQIYL